MLYGGLLSSLWLPNLTRSRELPPTPKKKIRVGNRGADGQKKKGMGLDPPAVTDCRTRYPSAWSNRNPCAKKDHRVTPGVFYVDAMEFLHSFNRKKHPTVEAFKREWAYWVTRFMTHDAPACHTYIIGIDQRRPGSFFIPKQVHTDAEREKRRAADAKKRAEKLEGMTEEELARQVYELDVSSKDPNRELPTDWGDFIRKRENRWHVYQLMVQTLLDPRFLLMQVGKLLVVMGLPVRKGPPVSFDQKVVYGVTLVEENITAKHVEEDPELFGRCLWIKGHQEPMRPAVTLYLNYGEWDTPTWEADLLPVHFYRFLAGQNWLVRSNDRDMLLTLLAHSMDRRRPGSDEFVDHMYLWMPNKAKKPKDGWRGDFYVDMNELYHAIDHDDELGADVYNRVLSYVFIMLLTGCDHVRKDMFFNLSTEHILKCFYDNSGIYRHMVQLSQLLIPDASAVRIPLIDERAAIDFISRVYLIKYGPMIAEQKRKDHEKAERKAERAYSRAVKAWEKRCKALEKKRATYARTAPRSIPMSMDDSDEGEEDAGGD
jgi:hypothetical protein